ncbi:hypothetical protein BDD12DRAFT_900719 [Trichophaea hybrida]|nr:hypothetical protein BDD12DRAFT_900719 [Trichophaea hybrida]
MSLLGLRTKKYKQSDPEVNEQGYLQPALEQDGLFPLVPIRSTEDYNIKLGASQNISGGPSIGHTAKSCNITARYNTSSSSGNTIMTNSNNTVDNTRTYNHAMHNEFQGSEFYGPVQFGDNFYQIPKPDPDHTILRRTQGDLDKLVQTIGWNILYASSFLDLQNIDFKQWQSAKAPQALLLSAPHGHGTTEVCSHIIDLEKASETNVACRPNTGRADSIATAFLSTLVGKHFQRHSPDFMEDDPLDITIKKILNAPDNELIEALADTFKKAGIRKLFIIVDGLWEGVADMFVHFIMEAVPELKALFTSQHNLLENIPDRMLYIEYNKERNGSHAHDSRVRSWLTNLACLRLLQYDDTRYDKISEEHHGSLEWLWEHPKYQEWSTSTKCSLLYIEGKPGSGKSTLVKYFEKKFVERVPNAGSSTVARYFYSFRGTKMESTHTNMLRSLLNNILEQDESTFFHFQQKFRDLERRNLSEWPYDFLKQVLSSFANHHSEKPLYLIIDAMDESDEDDRRDITKLLSNLCLKKIFDENKDDISRFADNFLKGDLGLTGEILRDAIDYIADNAKTGEWQYSGWDIQDSIRLFRYVLFALRPLTVNELRDAIAMQDDFNNSDEFQQNRTTAIKRRIEHCGGNFLEITADGTVQYMHQTARAFLIRAIPNALNLKFELSDEMANRTITTSLIRYLMLCFAHSTMQHRFSQTESWGRRDSEVYAEYLNETLQHTGHTVELSSTTYFVASFMDLHLGHNDGQTNPVSEHQETSENIKYNTLNAAAKLKLPHVKNALLTCIQDDHHVEQKTPLIISAEKGLAGLRAISSPKCGQGRQGHSGRQRCTMQ